MSDKEIDEINQIREEMREKTFSLRGRRYLDSELWREWFEDENRKPVCGIQVMNYMLLSNEKAKIILREYASKLVSIFQDVRESTDDKYLFNKRSINRALSEVFVAWVKNKKVIMYNSEEQFLSYLLDLVCINIELNKKLELERATSGTETAKHSYEEMVESKSSIPDDEVSLKRSKPTEEATLSGESFMLDLRGEEEAIRLIDKIRFSESLNVDDLKVWKLHSERRTEREISEAMDKPKTTIHDQIVRIESRRKKFLGE